MVWPIIRLTCVSDAILGRRPLEVKVPLWFGPVLCDNPPPNWRRTNAQASFNRSDVCAHTQPFHSCRVQNKEEGRRTRRSRQSVSPETHGRVEYGGPSQHGAVLRPGRVHFLRHYSPEVQQLGGVSEGRDRNSEGLQDRKIHSE